MTTYCRRCGRACHDESVFTPIVNSWSSCESCHFVWRSSLLDSFKFATRVNRRRNTNVAPPPPLESTRSDSVAEWLAEQEKAATLTLAPITCSENMSARDCSNDEVENFFDLLDS